MKWAAILAALALGVAACGGEANPNGPDPTPNPTDVITINVVGINGAQSFSPNPASVPAGHVVVWHNVDTVTHRVVLNDGTVDTGDIPAGGSSRAMTLTSRGDYKCSLHPSMVGTIAN